MSKVSNNDIIMRRMKAKLNLHTDADRFTNMLNVEEMGEYERRAMENKLRNLRLLQELGIMEEKRALDEQVKKYASARSNFIAKSKNGGIKKKESSDSAKPRTVAELRRSSRVREKPVDYTFREYERLFLGPVTRKRSSADPSLKPSAKLTIDPATFQFQRPAEPLTNRYGEIEGVKVGQEFVCRMDCSYSGVHRPPVSGIHGGPDGAYSVVLNGGYEDDVDYGDTFTYTGEGGRDLRGTKKNPKNLRNAPQSRDQTLTRGNLALCRSIETKNPVRVVRGYKLNNKRYAPTSGYRYDGLYNVQKCVMAAGLSYFNVYRFTLVRVPGQDPLPAS